jgi:L-2-hydroxycarboxylate dehydrogenase (NAD+)
VKTVSVRDASAVCVQALRRAGVSQEHAYIQAELLLESELRGRASHGIQRLPRIVARIGNGVAKPDSKGKGAWRGEAFLDVDGQQGLGPVVAFSALAQIAERAKRTGVAVAAIRNCNHLGMLALYAERFAQQGQILIALTTSEALVHPWGGRTAMLGTNPIAIGIPAEPQPFVLDMATSLVSMGQIHDYANRNAPLEPGWALDANGDPTTDAAAAREGAIAPFGGAKGYALGLAFEVLVASLTASALGPDVGGTLDATQICNKGDVFIVLEPAGNAVCNSVSAYLDAVRECAPTDPARAVVVPGDRAQRMRERSIDTGIAVPDEVWKAIVDLANQAPRDLISQDIK